MDEKTTTESVTVKSAGTVKITVEEYNDLQTRANRPQNVTYNQTVKTDAMRAEDNVMYGSLLMGGGATVFLIGAVQLAVGLKQRKAL